MSTEPDPYTGPSVAHMLATRTFASCVIAQHGTKNAVFDEENLAFLREFAAEPGKKDLLLLKHNMLDPPSDRPGTAANKKGSLPGVVIARYGTSETAMSEDDVGNLRVWFESGEAGI